MTERGSEEVTLRAPRPSYLLYSPTPPLPHFSHREYDSAGRCACSKTESPRARAGATLTEVLIALMIMSIGIVALAVMFPLSVLRTVKATQLTNATDLRYNAEALIDMYPAMIKKPINPNYQYISGNNATNVATADPPLTTNYVIDPIGFVNVQNLAAIGAVANGLNFTNRPEHYFGNTGASTWNGQSTLFGIARYPLFWRTPAAAAAIATLPDSWQLQYENFRFNFASNAPAGDGVTQINVTGLGASGFQLPVAGAGGATPITRAVLFSPDGTASQVRALTQVTGDTITWSENATGVDVNQNGVLDDYPLPTSFQNPPAGNGIGNVRIETQDQRYTWLLTVRQSAVGLGSVDVVVFFTRPDNLADDELLYPASFGFNSLGNLSTQQVTVSYVPPQKPFMRKGGFVFDAANAYWYRISSVTDTGAGTATLTIEVPVNASILAANGGRAMFPRGVVDVFPIGSKSFP